LPQDGDTGLKSAFEQDDARSPIGRAVKINHQAHQAHQGTEVVGLYPVEF